MIQNRRSCYCAFCKNQRKVYASKHLNLMGVISLIVLSYVLTYVIWNEPDARGLTILMTLLVAGEGFTQLRWRQSLICKNCGFDPVLYIRNPEKAGLRIKEFLNYRSERPEYLLKPSVKMPVRRVSTPDEITTGRNLSLRG